METTNAAADAPKAAAEIAGSEENKADVLVGKSLCTKIASYAKNTAAGLGLKPVKMPVLQKLRQIVGEDGLRRLIRKQIDKALAATSVSYGIDDAVIADAVETCLKQIAVGNADAVTRKIAQGDLPEPGKPAQLQYLLNVGQRPMGELEGVAPTSNKVWMHVVHKGDVLVQLVPRVEGKPGRSVLGERIDPPGAGEETVHLSSIVGANTVIEGNKLLATCEGACEENATGRVRVVPEIVLRNVDAISGSVPPAGMTHASVAVCGEVKSPYGISTTENVFVGVGGQGLVEKAAFISAMNLVVNGTIQGVQEDNTKENRAVVDVEELCVARELDGRLLRAGRLLVGGDCRMARLEIDEWARIDGDVVGSTVFCRQELTVVGHLGSAEGGSLTRVVVPMDDGVSRKTRRLDTEVAKKKKELALFQEKQQQLQADNAKRAKSDAFWAMLLNGEERSPKTPLEGHTLHQFHEMCHHQKNLGHMVRETLLALRLLQEKRAASDDKGEQFTGAVVRVGGQFFLDAAIEATHWVQEGDLDATVTYSVEGKRFRNHKLRDVLQILSRQATEYQQAREEAVSVRREAIDKMFEGRDARPTGPKIVHRTFELGFEWAGDDASEADTSPLQVQYTAIVHTSEPRKMKLVALATLPEVKSGVELTISREGPRVTFALGASGVRVSRWADDPNMVQLLESMAIRGLTGRQVLNDEQFPEESVEVQAPPVSEVVSSEKAT